MAELQRITLNPEGVSPPVATYSHIARVKASELVFMAGQIGIDSNGNLAGADVGPQVLQVFENIRLNLAGVGATFKNVVEFTVYVVGRESVQPYMEARTAILRDAYPDGDYPPSTLLVVSGLASEEYKVEIKAVAALP